MKNSVRRNVRLCVAVFGVAALGLSACSGGDDDDSMSSVTGGTPTMSATMQEPEQAPASVADLALAAYAAGDAVEKAATDEMKRAGDNLADAQSAVAVGGSSAAAEAAARMVLDAQRALMNEIERAKAARDAAQERHDADGTTEEDKANLMAAIEDVNEGITTAEESLKTIDGNVMTIRGTNAEDPNEPAYWGTQTAEAIQGLLTADTPPTTIAGDNPADAAVDEKAVRRHNAEGMTWGQILGGDVMDRRLAGVTGDDKVPSTPIAGKKASEFTVDSPIDTVSVQSTAGTPASYKGIAGTVHCDNGSGCMVTGGVLGAGWYFVPNPASRTGRFIKDPANTDAYIAEIYAEYGYWLRRGTAGDDDDGDNTVTFFHRTLTGTSTAATSFNTLRAGNDNSKTAMEAEYSGEAIGLSFRTVTGSDSTRTSISSGQFTADVNLKAEFGVEQSGAGLSGTVRNFRGDGVNTNWRVTLGRAAIGADGAVTGATVTVGDSNADVGSWNAQAFGRTQTGGPGRPDGFRGGFDATFSDGRATGVFATRKR